MYEISLIVQSLEFYKLYNCVVSVNFTIFFLELRILHVTYIT